MQYCYSYKVYSYLNGNVKKFISSSASISFKTSPLLSILKSTSTISAISSFPISLSLTTNDNNNNYNNNNYYNNNNVTNAGIVLLAGGKGKRMQSTIPKQFLSLLGKPVFLRSLDIFKLINKNIISSIVIVLDESYRNEYQYLLQEDSRISWANPGKERQDSVYNGIQAIPDSCSIVGKKESTVCN